MSRLLYRALGIVQLEILSQGGKFHALATKGKKRGRDEVSLIIGPLKRMGAIGPEAGTPPYSANASQNAHGTTVAPVIDNRTATG